MVNYGMTLKWDLVTQSLTIVSGNPIYQHSVGRHYLWVEAELAVGNLLDVTFSQGGQTTYATTMNYIEQGKYQIEIPDIVLANSGTMRISLAVKSPVVVGGAVKYTLLTSGIINASIITSIAEPLVNLISPSEADKLNGRMTDLTNEVIQFEQDINQSFDEFKTDVNDTLDSFVAPTVEVGTTTTVTPNTPAKVTNSGTDKFAVLNFEIPQGIKGEQGDKGERGMTLRLWYSYDPTQTYLNNEDYIDMVSYGGTTFGAKKDTQGNVPTESEFWGVVAVKGTDGKNFQISGVFNSIAEMNAHFADFVVGDFVMIENGEQDHDSGKMFVKGQTQFEFVTDLSGSQGIQGVSITNVLLTGSSGLVDTYTINYSNNTTSTFEVTNGADGADGADGANGTNGVDGADGKSAFVRYSAFPDGTAFTQNWVDGQNYVGIATALTAPTVASGYVWADFVGKNGKDGADGTNGKTIWQAQIAFDGTNYTVENIENATVGDYAMGLSGAYAGYFGEISNIGATVSTLLNVVNLNGADGSGAGNVVATNASVTQGTNYVFKAVSKDVSGNISGEFADISTFGYLTDTAIVNARSEETDKTYSAKYVEDTFAPKSFFENLYLTKATDTTANLTQGKPNVAVSNFLTTTTTNTAIAWATPELTLSRTFQSEIQFDNKSAISVMLDVAFNRNANVEYGAVAKINGNIISTQQAFGLMSYNGDTAFTNVYGNKFDVILDLILSPTSFNVGDVLTVEIFKRQSVATALTSRIFCGVTVSGSARFSFVSYNFTALSLNTNQITDGAITLAKIDPNAIDILPTQGSVKLVTSGGVYGDLELKQDKLVFDNTPTQGSGNSVTSGTVFASLSGKQNNLIFDNVPTENSGNVVTSGGVFLGLATKQPKNITFENVAVPTTEWVENTTTTNYKVKTNIPLNGVTSTMVPQVNFAIDNSASGNFCNVAESYNGGVTIFAVEKPTETITIPNIILTEVN